MNRKQLLVLWIGVSLIFLMCLFPPWVRFREGFSVPGLSDNPYMTSSRESVGYYCIAKPPGKMDVKAKYLLSYGQFYLDISRLVVQCIVVALLTGAGIYTLRVKGK